MLKRLVARKLKVVYFNLHIQTHRYFQLGIRIRPEKINSIFDAEIICNLDIDLFLGFISIFINFNR